jgi:hypothetical protein
MFQQTLCSLYQKKYCVYSEALTSVIDYISVWVAIQRTITKVGRETLLGCLKYFPWEPNIYLCAVRAGTFIAGSV